MNPKKLALIVFVSLASFFAIAQVYVNTDNSFRVTHKEKIERPGYEDYAERYVVEISPKVAYEKAGERVQVKAYRILGLITLVALGIFILIWSLSLYEFDRVGNWIAFGLMTLAAIFLFAAHGSVFTSNSVEVTPEVYEKIKNSKQLLAELFNKRITL